MILHNPEARRSDALLIPPLFYLETSAVRHLVEQPQHDALRRHVERLQSEGRLLLCTSHRTLEEIVTTIPGRDHQLRAVLWLSGMTPKGFISVTQAEVVRRWLYRGSAVPDRIFYMGTWPQPVEQALDYVPQMQAMRDGIGDVHQQLRDLYKPTFADPEFPAFLGRKPAHWHDPENLYQEVRTFADGTIATREDYVKLFSVWFEMGKDGVTEELVWASRENPWVRLVLRHMLAGVGMQTLRKTTDDDLRNDGYDHLHVVFGSVADALVVDDRRLAESITHLRVGDTPKVFMLDERRDGDRVLVPSWASELDQCT